MKTSANIIYFNDNNLGLDSFVAKVANLHLIFRLSNEILFGEIRRILSSNFNAKLKRNLSYFIVTDSLVTDRHTTCVVILQRSCYVRRKIMVLMQTRLLFSAICM